MKRTIIRNCMLLDDGAEHGVISGACVAVKDGRIAYAGPEDAYRPEEGPSDTLDACGALALPGLINAHTHVAMALFRSAANAYCVRSLVPTDRNDIFGAIRSSCSARAGTSSMTP
mgnify:CR=1 FL=1